MDDLNPQAREMADESMVRNLAAQADAIWPQEKGLFDRYRLPANPNVLDAGCGTGEISQRLAQMFSQARVLGVDIIDDHLDMARAKCAALGARVRFENRSIFDLGSPAAHFDLVVCRHVFQAIQRRLSQRKRCGVRVRGAKIHSDDPFGQRHVANLLSTFHFLLSTFYFHFPASDVSGYLPDPRNERRDRGSY